MLTHPLARYFCFAYHLLVACMQIGSVLLLFKRRAPGSHLMLVGGTVGVLGVAAGQATMLLASKLGWETFGSSGTPPALRVVEISYALSVLGTLAFQVGLLTCALRLKQQSTRIAELEAILGDKPSSWVFVNRSRRQN